MKLSEVQKQQINQMLPLMTNEEWQKLFQELRTGVKADSNTYLKNRYSSDRISHGYDGETEYYRYTEFINDILRSIRAGQKDYCFKVEHILDLLRFEHDRLQTEWLQDDLCFCVSICIDNKLNTEV